MDDGGVGKDEGRAEQRGEVATGGPRWEEIELLTKRRDAQTDPLQTNKLRKQLAGTQLTPPNLTRFSPSSSSALPLDLHLSSPRHLACFITHVPCLRLPLRNSMLPTLNPLVTLLLASKLPIPHGDPRTPHPAHPDPDPESESQTPNPQSISTSPIQSTFRPCADTSPPALTSSPTNPGPSS